MDKATQIKLKLNEPIKVGDSVTASIPYIKVTRTFVKKKAVESVSESISNHSGTVAAIIDNPVHGLCYEIDTQSTSIPYEAQLPSVDFDKSTSNIFKAEWVKQSIWDCGANPFQPKVKVNFISTDIGGLLYRGAYAKRSDTYLTPEYNVINGKSEEDKPLMGKTYGGINFNPYILDIDGNKCYYQRDLVWTLEQKQLLIHSIYNGIEIGKFIFKYNSWKGIVNQIKETGHGFNFECVDGKQRYHAILEFLQNKFPDEFGNYWNDLSMEGQSNFLSYNNMAVGEMDENAKAKDIRAAFLVVNFSGTPMSRENIEFVQKIKL